MPLTQIQKLMEHAFQWATTTTTRPFKGRVCLYVCVSHMWIIDCSILEGREHMFFLFVLRMHQRPRPAPEKCPSIYPFGGAWIPDPERWTNDESILHHHLTGTFLGRGKRSMASLMKADCEKIWIGNENVGEEKRESHWMSTSRRFYAIRFNQKCKGRCVNIGRLVKKVRRRNFRSKDWIKKISSFWAFLGCKGLKKIKRFFQKNSRNFW